jgi:uncharacterized membrane protein YkoI
MRRLQGTKVIRVGLCALLLLTAGGLKAVARADKNTQGLAAEHVIACIRTAAAVQPGLVKEVEAEYERGQWLCEVKLVDEAGKRHTLHVDVATNQVVKTK